MVRELSIYKRRSSLVCTYFILILDGLGFTFLYPIFPVIFTGPSFNFITTSDPTVKSIVFGVVILAFPLAQFFGAPLFGDIADRHGRKKALFYSLSGSFIGYSLTAIGVLIRSFSLILIGRLVTGFFSVKLSICLSALSDLNNEKKKRAKFFSFAAGSLGIAWILGIGMAILFIFSKEIRHYDYSLPFWGAAFLALVSLLILQKFFFETNAQTQKNKINLLKNINQIKSNFESRQLRTLFLTLLLWFLGFIVSLQWTAPVSIEEFKVKEVTIFIEFLFLGVIWTLSSFFLHPWVIRRFSIWRSVLWALFLTSLFYFFSAVTDFFFYFGLSLILSSIFTSLSWTNTMTLISLGTLAENQGKTLGVAQSALAAAQILSSIFGGLIAGFHIEAIPYFSSIAVFAGFIILLIYIVQRSRLLKKI